MHGDRAAALGFLAPIEHHLADHGLGSVAEIFDADPPFTPNGCPAQAWSVAEVLRAWVKTAPEEAAPPEGHRRPGKHDGAHKRSGSRTLRH